MRSVFKVVGYILKYYTIVSSSLYILYYTFRPLNLLYIVLYNRYKNK